MFRYWFKAALLLFLLTTFGSQLWADGKVFRPVDVAEDPWIPDQRALLHWVDGHEVLVIETSVRGGGENLAWVVPLPAAPVVEEAPADLFPVLSAAFSPKILTENPWYLLVPLAVVVVWIGHRLIRDGTNRAIRILFGVLAGTGLLALVLAGLSYGKIMAGGSGGDVEILSVQNAGVFQATTLRSGNALELSDWLNANGYHAPLETQPAVEAYVREGWVFVAMKIREGIRPESGTLHPVAFRFAAEKPVYPMRLTATGTAGKPLALDLFILGPESAAVAGMEMKRSSRINVKSWDLDGRTLDGASREVRRWFGEASFGTWLRGVLPASRLAEDVYPLWNGDTIHEPAVTSSNGAAVAALNRTLPTLAGGLLILLLSKKVHARWRRFSERAGVFAAGAAVAWGITHFALLEKAEVRGRQPSGEARADRKARFLYRDLYSYVEADVDKLTPKSEGLSPGVTTISAAVLKSKALEWLEPKIATVFADDEPVTAWPALVFQDREYGVEAWYHPDPARRVRLAVWDREGRPDQSPGRAPL